MKCRQCGFEIKETDQFCRNCGMKAEKTCPYCGAVVGNDKKFCPYCGNHLIQTNEHPAKKIVESNTNEDEDFWPKMTDDQYRNRLVITTRVITIAFIIILLISFYVAFSYQYIYGWKWFLISGVASAVLIACLGLGMGGYFGGERIKKYDTALKNEGEEAAKEVAKFKTVDIMCIVVMVLLLIFTPSLADYTCSSIAKRVLAYPNAGVIKILFG